MESRLKTKDIILTLEHVTTATTFKRCLQVDQCLNHVTLHNAFLDHFGVASEGDENLLGDGPPIDFNLVAHFWSCALRNDSNQL